MELNNKNILVVGASSEIGTSLYSKLIKKGANVIGTCFNNKNSSFFKCDITNEEDIIKLKDYLKEKYQTIDIIINLSATYHDNDIYEKTKEEFMKVLETNLVGPFLIIKHISSLINEGIIINMSSNESRYGQRIEALDYDASKAGIENLTVNLSKRFKNIKMLSLAPEYINTKGTLEMEKHYLEDCLRDINQEKLLDINDVVDKIIDMLEKDSYKTGQIIDMKG